MSKLLQQRWDKYTFKKHKEKLLLQSSTIDIAKPSKYPHLQINLKQIEKNEERQSIVDYQNHVLLKKLTNILKNRSKLDNWNDFETTSHKIFNSNYRFRKENEVQKMNKKMAVNLSKVKSSYSASGWVDDFNKHNYYIALSQSSTKDFDANGSKLKIRAGGNLQKSQFSSVHVKQKPLSNYEESDVDLLYKVCKNLNQPDEVFIKTLIKKDLNHRLSVVKKFMEVYNMNLKESLQTSVDQDYHALIEVLLENSHEVKIKLMRQALENGDLFCLLDLFLLLNEIELAKLRQAYIKHYGVNLTEDIDKFVKNSDIANIMLCVLEGVQHGNALDESRAVLDAKQLAIGDIYLAGSELLSKEGLIASSLSFGLPQICALERAYHKECGLSLCHLIGKNYNEDVVELFDELISSLMHNKSIEKQVLFLHDRMACDDVLFLRRLLELDEMGFMDEVCRSYQKKYRIALSADIIFRCSGAAVVVVVELCKQKKLVVPLPKTVNATAFTSSKVTTSRQPNAFRATHRGKIQVELGKALPHRQSANAPGASQPMRFDMLEQVKMIHRALRGVVAASGLNNKHVRLLLISSSSNDRIKLCDRYRRTYATDLLEDLAQWDDGGGGRDNSVVMKEFCKAWFMSEDSYALNLVQNAMTNDSIFMLESAPVLVALTNCVKTTTCLPTGTNKYEGTNLFRGLLVCLLECRPISHEQETAQECAKRLHLSSFSRKLTLDMLRSGSLNHLVDSLTFLAQLTNECHVSDCILKHFEEAHHLVRLVSAYQKPTEFLANEIVDCTDIELVQIICWRLENDLATIEKLLRQMHDARVSLSTLIQSSGLSKTMSRFLLELIDAKIN